MFICEYVVGDFGGGFIYAMHMKPFYDDDDDEILISFHYYQVYITE